MSNKRFIKTTNTIWDNLPIEEKIKYHDSIVFIETEDDESNPNTGIIEVGGVRYVGSHSNMIKISYSELVNLRNNGLLVPGQQYRIIDYIATSTQDNTQCVPQNSFDVIVTATSKSQLDEKSRAISSDNSTYYNDNKLCAWEVWYCLDNDISRFSWSDNNGKGVVYRLIDEFGNDVPFDFKGIKINSDIESSKHYLFQDKQNIMVDYSLTGNVIGNKINPCFNANGQQIINDIHITKESDNCKMLNNYIGYNVDNLHINETTNTEVTDNYIGNNNKNIKLSGSNIINYNVVSNTNNGNLLDINDIQNSSRVRMNIARKSNGSIVIYNESDLIADQI